MKPFRPSHGQRVHTALSALALAAAACGLTGCRPPARNAYVPPPPPEVTVATPTVREVEETLELTGVTRPFDQVEVRARVKGFVQKRHVEGGQRVKAGDLIYTIDPREFEATVRRWEAEVAAREATLRLAQTTLKRNEEASRSGAVSVIEVERATAERDAAVAQLDLSKAELTRAKLDLEFTLVRSPINGRLGVKTVDVGQLVGSGEATLLATIANDESVYAVYSIDERQVLELRSANENRRPGEDGRDLLEVRLGQANDEGYPFVGRFSKADTGIDARTGTITIEALFENSNGALLPGAFVRLQVLLGKAQATLIPESAIGADQAGRFALVVGDKDIVERRAVRVGAPVGRDRRILEGLAPTDRVIVNGLQRARPGSPVKPQAQATAPAPAK
jgi:RND family efflux transporter MFP subunit